MKTRTMIVLLCSLVMMIALPNQTIADVPPLLDRELFFGDPEISGGQLSPDGAYISFMRPYEGTRNLWIKERDADFADALPVTDRTDRPIMGYFWSRDGKYLLFVMDQGGDENFNIYALDPSEARQGVIPTARNLTHLEEVRAQIYHISRKDPDLIFVGLNERDAAWHDLYKLRISTGELTRLRENTNRYTSWVFDHDDNLRLASRSKENGDNELWRMESDGTETLLYEWNITETAYPYFFHENNKMVYFVTNKGDLDKTKLFMMNVRDGEKTLVEKDPENRVDFGGMWVSEKTLRPIATFYVDDRTRVYFKDDDFEKHYSHIKRQLGDVEVRFGSATHEEDFFLIIAFSDVSPSSVYLYDMKTMELTYQYSPRKELPSEYMASMQSIRYPSSDGLEIQAYLTLPKGFGESNLPLVVVPHGGPWARDTWGFDTYAQFLSNRGYAVLQPNFRGSTGFGKAFLNAGNLEWGDLMQDDITWGVKYLIEQGIADPERVGIFGGSYGGYATLAGLAFTPDLYACGISFVGPSNLLTLLSSIPPYWEAARSVFHERMGDPSTEEGKQRLIRQSPLFSADQIVAPLMVVQGQNDPRVKKAESDQIVVALRDRGFPVEYLNAPDEGHGFARPENNMAFVAAKEKFMAQHLGGRYQEDMPDHIANRLKEITVDVSTVTLPEELSAEELGMVLRPVRDLPLGVFNFETVMKVMGQEVKLSREVSISRENDQYIIKEKVKAEAPLMETIDEMRLKADNLQPLLRNLSQGHAKISMEYSDTGVNGTIDTGAQQIPLSIELDSPLFGEGPGFEFLLATLPLAENYQAVYQTADINSMAARRYRMRANEEIMEDGTLTWRIESKPADGSPGSAVIWVDQESFMVLRFEQMLPEMGGAVMEGTLVKE